MNRSRVVRVACASMAVVCGSAGAQSRPLRLLVVNQGNATMSVVDPVAQKTVATVDEHQTKMHAHEIAVAPDGRTVYMPVYGDVGVGKPGLNGNEMLVVDAPTGQIKSRVDFGQGVRPHCPVYDRTRNVLYVTTEINKTVSIIDPKTLKIVGTIPTGAEQSHMLALSPDGKRGYTANVQPGSVSVLDLEHRKLVKIIPVSGKTQRIAVAPDGRWVFTSDHEGKRMAVIDAGRNEIVKWIDLGGLGYGSAFTRDGKRLLVPLTDQKQVAVIDLASMKVERTIPVIDDPQEMLVSPDGTRAYVAGLNGTKVAVIDLRQWKMTGTIEVGPRPDGLAWARF